MIVVVVIGILGSIAYPAYLDSARKARRSDGVASLEAAANAMERYRVRNNGSYVGAVLGDVAGAVYGATSAGGHYTMSFADSDGDGSTLDEPNTNTFVITATATGVQADDTNCATLSLSQAAARTATGAADANDICW